MEAQDKVLVAKAFSDSRHGEAKCTQCHGGTEPAGTRADAHRHMTANPAKVPLATGGDGKNVCSSCHSGITKAFAGSLHRTTAPVSDPRVAVVLARARAEDLATLKPALENHCSACHITSCGDCHISRPEWSGGGFVDGHKLQKAPNSISNCTACHGSRIEKEMMAEAPETVEPRPKPDVHWSPKGMQCVACHKESALHGTGQTTPANRYADPLMPRCEDCHDVGKDGVAAHRQHGLDGSSRVLLQCQVCHAQPYNNCYGCHVGKDDKGLAYFKTDKSVFGFKIGRNPVKSAERPYDYVVVRHVPVARDTFAYYGQDLLKSFDAVPTFKYATPHSIALKTAQNASCASCHNNPNLFLQEKDVAPDERAANQDVIVKRLPFNMGR